MWHECNFSKPSRALVCVEETLERVRVLVSGHFDDASALEGHTESVDQRAAVAEWLRGAHSAVDTILVGDGEHFLCRQIRREGNAVAAGAAAAHPDVPVGDT